MIPARPKGTIEDWKAGNLEPAKTKEPTVPNKGSRTPRRKPNPGKFSGASEAALNAAVEQTPAHPPKSAVTTVGVPSGSRGTINAGTAEPTERPPWQRVMDDLERKRDDINRAIKALKELYT